MIPSVQQNNPHRTMRSIFLLLLMAVQGHLFAQGPTVKGNDPQLTARMNGQMAKRPTAVFEENKGQMKDQHWQPRPDVLFNGSAQGMLYSPSGRLCAWKVAAVNSEHGYQHHYWNHSLYCSDDVR